MAIFMNLYFVSITHSYKQSLPHTYEKKKYINTVDYQLETIKFMKLAGLTE